MKKNLKITCLIFLVVIIAAQPLWGQKRKDLTGNWKVYVPYAPENQNFLVKITRDSVFVSPGENPSMQLGTTFKYEDNTLRFDIQDVYVSAKLEGKNKMTGLSTWNGGQSEIIFTRITGKKARNK